ncbi:helix-turn-helix domain-containing protein [Pseudobacteriovorax antillogorgiicola]|uniref:Transcriptional regulator, y4mF family n=1 Tax=Pseudobacteriovorax antillogorgiicola TaxID=1513793 RepID=A0A1Y6CXM9_9BACT|nr:helix-turn-helix domain-containing protein [Pseudobacteriovorax antillogorgiicola]TCS41466.1 y4mF family transcriptional regulator [Pseudobacteriovorax antillogorgiicola]SMF83659.1 transcriptional regulator, y4mF family [Pseudobacteriovorax antillogorgiicola]
MRRTLSEIYETAGPIAVFVREKRKELGYTQEVLARRIGVGVRFFRELEQGKQSLRLDKVRTVVEFLGGVITVKERGPLP